MDNITVDKYWNGLPRWLSGKESPASGRDTGDIGLIPGSGRSPGGGNGNPLQYSCLGNPMDRGVWQVKSMGSQKSQTWLGGWAHMQAGVYQNICFHVSVQWCCLHCYYYCFNSMCQTPNVSLKT